MLWLSWFYFNKNIYIYTLSVVDMKISMLDIEHLNVHGRLGHHGRLVHNLSLPNFNYLLDVVLPFPPIWAYDIH